MITFRKTLNNLSADIRRRLMFEEKTVGFFSVLSVLLKGGVVSVILYRFSHYFAHTPFRFLNKLLLLIDQIYTRNEISHSTHIGPGLVLGDNGAIGISGTITVGSNCTFLGANSITLGAMEGFSYETHTIVIGDYCVFGHRARLMRPISLADGTQVKPNSLVMVDVKDSGVTLVGLPAKRRGVEDLAQIKNWNPFKGKPLIGHQQ